MPTTLQWNELQRLSLYIPNSRDYICEEPILRVESLVDVCLPLAYKPTKSHSARRAINTLFETVVRLWPERLATL